MQETTKELVASMSQKENSLLTVHIIENHPNDSRVKYCSDNVFQALTSRMGTGGGNVPMIQETKAVDCRNGTESDINGTFQAKSTGGTGVNFNNVVRENKTVRRLTPLECERLMGLPDSWTDVEFNGKPAPDSRRYKAIGNGMAVPCSTFILKRLVAISNREMTE